MGIPITLHFDLGCFLFRDSACRQGCTAKPNVPLFLWEREPRAVALAHKTNGFMSLIFV
jgi:hypothetical protein